MPETFHRLSFVALFLISSLSICSFAFGQRLAESVVLPYVDPTVSSVFARRVALDDGTIVISSTSHGSRTRLYDRALIFERGAAGWNQVDVIQGSGYELGEEFGSDVGVAGSLIVVGSKTDRDLGIKSGSVYLFEKQGTQWQETQKIYASDGGLNGFFGEALTVSADSGVERIAVGSRNPARAYIFERDATGSFVETARLLLEGEDEVYELELVGDRLAVGTSRVLYVFELDADGIWQRRLRYSPGGFAGSDIGFSGEVVGTLVRIDNQRAYQLFEREESTGEWQLLQALVDPDGGRAFLADFELDKDRIFMPIVRQDEALGGYLEVGYVYDRNPATGLFELGSRLVADGFLSEPYLFFNGAVDDGRMILIETGTNHLLIYEDREPSALAVELDGPTVCVAGDSASFLATSSGGAPVRRLDSWVDDQAEVLECVDCGIDTVVPFDRDLEACYQDVEVTVRDPDGTFAWNGLTVHRDDRAPSIFCSDRHIMVPFGAGGAIVNTSVNGRDTCDGVIPATCDVPRGFLSVGVHTVNCSVADQCGNASSCSFQVEITEVEPLPPGPGCSDSLFTGQIDPIPPPTPWQWAALGNSALIAPVIDDRGLVVSGTGSTMYHLGDNGMFAYRSESADNFRIEVPVPSHVGDSGQTYQKGGVMVRYDLSPQSLRVMAMFVPDHPNGPSIQWDVRHTVGRPAVELASTLSTSTVTHVAIEKDGTLYRVEYSEDHGTTWHQPAGGLGGQAVFNQPPGDALIGLATASYDSTTPAAFAVPTVRFCENPLD